MKKRTSAGLGDLFLRLAVIFLAAGLLLGLVPAFFLKPRIREEVSALPAEPIVVGSKDATETLLLGKITAQLLEDRGFAVEERTGIGSTEATRMALEAGMIDLCWEYTGTALESFWGKEPSSDPHATFESIKQLDAEIELQWLETANFNSNYTFFLSPALADAGLASFSDLETYTRQTQSPLRLCSVADEYFKYSDDLEATYDLTFGETPWLPVQTFADSEQLYRAFSTGRCDLVAGFVTEGWAWGIPYLADDKSALPALNPAPVVRESTLDRYGGLAVILASVGSKLDAETMTSLNRRVDPGGEDVEAVAGDFLRSFGLVEPEGPEPTPEPIYTAKMAFECPSAVQSGQGEIATLEVSLAEPQPSTADAVRFHAGPYTATAEMKAESFEHTRQQPSKTITVNQSADWSWSLVPKQGIEGPQKILVEVDLSDEKGRPPTNPDLRAERIVEVPYWFLSSRCTRLGSFICLCVTAVCAIATGVFKGLEYFKPRRAA